jgi:D-alanyl-D-alanine carboxypeptidase
VTKTFTGTVILQLVDEGKLKLDESIARWFPTAPEASEITIRELGDMSSGINSYTADEAITARYFTHPQTIWKADELIDGGLALPRKFAPGKGFFYSDTNTLMLGKIAEAVTGKSPTGARPSPGPRARSSPPCPTCTAGRSPSAPAP